MKKKRSKDTTIKKGHLEAIITGRTVTIYDNRRMLERTKKYKSNKRAIEETKKFLKKRTHLKYRGPG